MRRERGARGRGARCQRGAPVPVPLHPAPGPRRPGSLGASAAPSGRRGRGGVRRGGRPGAGSGGRGHRGRGASRRGHVTGLFTNTAGALAVARGGRRGGSGPRIGAGDPGDEPGRSGARGARVGGVNLETRWPRLFQLSSGGLGLSGWGARVGVPGVCCPRCRWVSAGDTGSRGAALGAPPSRLLGDWPPSRLRGALGRPRAEVTAAEFLPGRFPAPPQRPCQRGGREFTPARRNQGASPASISREVGLAGQPRPRTASGASSLATDLLWVSLPQVVTFLLLARVGGRGTTCSFGPGPGACHL